MIRVDAEKLRELAKRRGLATFEAIAEEAKRRNIKLGVVTIYSIAANENWTRNKLEALCEVLSCDPRDFTYFERNGHTYAVRDEIGERQRSQRSIHDG